MSELRPKHMTQGEFAAMLREAGFPACSKAAVSLAERSKESGVQFTPAARKAAQGLLNSKPRTENRVNGNKTTVWLDDELREWVQTQAYLEGISVGQLLRRIIWQAKHDYSILRNPMTGEPYSFGESDGAHCAPLQGKAASDAATSEAAGAPETSGRHSAVPTGHLHDTPKQEENQG